MITSSNPITLQAAIGLAYRLTNDVIRSSGVSKRNDNERKRKNDQQRNQDRNQLNKRRQVTCNYGVATQEQRPYNGHTLSVLNATSIIWEIVQGVTIVGRRVILPRYARTKKSGKTLVVQGDKPTRNLKIISAIKMRKYLKRECFAFLAHIVKKDQKVKRIQDIPVVKNYPEVFTEDLPGPRSSR
ncbi:hypothetical protein Tco_0941596 [Tanacetum coccineum]|uniref:Uncharacterized protein n=1 Tax=Tanacetum coccineum TaxID=301880 RepID=A0ABQ5DTW9_9ASTR